MRLHEIQSEAEARRFLPAGGGDYGLLLFVRSGDPACATVVASAAAQPDPRKLHVLDVDRCPHASRWFGLVEVPSLVAVADGALIAIEQRWGPETLKRLDAVANAALCRIDDW